jgi:cellulose synthase/poly-beta-1,6-N-acetylglucosamine synthase-like glycosyltransferase
MDIHQIYKSSKYSNLTVIDKTNGGKSSALNTGIYFSKFSFFCAIDADTIIMKDALIKSIQPFINDPNTIAVGGILRVGNGQINSQGELSEKHMNFDLLPLLQTIEYERDFKLGRLGWFAIQSTILVSGAFGVFNKEAVKAVGGYNDASIGEDLELLMRIHNIFGKAKDEYKVVFLPEETCWTETPATYSVLYNQRNRWHRGLMDSFSINKDILLNPEYGLVGMISVPYYFFVEVYGPIIKFLNYFIIFFALLTGIISLQIFIPIIIISFLFRIMMNLSTILLDNLYFNEKPKFINFLFLAFASMVDGVGYKQFVSISTFFGFIDYFKKKKGWGKMERKGLKDQ